MKLLPSKADLRLTVIALAVLAGFAAPICVMAGPGYTPVRDVNDGISNPFAAEVSWFSGTTSGFTETSSYTVPATNRVEITEISCEAYAPSSTQVIMKLTVTCGGVTLTHYLTSMSASLVYPNYWLMSMTSHHIYVDPGTTITIDVVRQTPPGASTGYYSDVILTGRMTGL
jgi:hypothetical protein